MYDFFYFNIILHILKKPTTTSLSETWDRIVSFFSYISSVSVTFIENIFPYHSAIIHLRVHIYVFVSELFILYHLPSSLLDLFRPMFLSYTFFCIHWGKYKQNTVVTGSPNLFIFRVQLLWITPTFCFHEMTQYQTWVTPYICIPFPVTRGYYFARNGGLGVVPPATLFSLVSDAFLLLCSTTLVPVNYLSLRCRTAV